VVQEVHTSVKGRARYKVERLYRSESLKKRIELSLVNKDGIRRVQANVLTGSVLVIFNSENSIPGIASLIEKILLDPHAQADAVSEGASGGNGSGRHAQIGRGDDALEAAGSDEQREAWHFLDSASVLAAFNSSRSLGLSAETAAQRLKQLGANTLPESLPRSGFSVFVDQFKSLPVALLGVAAGLSLLTAGVADAVVILGVVIINATIGYTTETQADRTIQSLKNLVRPFALVVRDGQMKTVKAEELVVGDLLVVKPGTYIAADARLLEGNNLYLDESALTGESMPVYKTPPAIPKRYLPLADRVNMLYMGTLATGGSGLAVVVATGRETEMGRIQILVGEAESPETPMERQLSALGSQLVLISGGVCGLVFLIGLLRGYGFLETLKFSISLAVAAVPEGLPTVATTTLALGIRNMRRHHVMIRRLEAVETLGSIQTICLDKTGTLTVNRMEVKTIYAGTRSFQVADGKFRAGPEKVNPFGCPELLRLIEVCVLCSETEVSMEKGEYVLKGSSTENALFHVALSAGVDVLKLRERHPVLKIDHRSENRNFMSTVHRVDPSEQTAESSLLLAVKGSPAEVLAMCRWQIKEGKKVILSEEDRFNLELENERMSGKALRVLGTAFAYADAEGAAPLEGALVWLGLIGMSDSIREGVQELMGVFHQAGIETVMITGDQGPTAFAIAKELNLAGGDPIEILDSTHLTNLKPEVRAALFRRVHVFARVSPAHKLQIVQALQKAGRVVAMTGDGINDGPALKAADIGIAMGNSGTDVAREVADVVLEQDDLETMIIAISHGRTIYNNIRKSVHFLLSTNLSEIMVVFTAISCGLGQPLNAMQLLWINLISDIFPGLALALEDPEPDVLSQPPRNPETPIIQRSDFKRISFEAAALSIGTLGAYGYGLSRYGLGPRAGTLAFLTLTTGQLLHAISCRSETHSLFDQISADRRSALPPNRYLWAALGGSFALQGLALTLPGLRALLGITPIGLIDGAVVAGSALLPLVVNEATKTEKRKKNSVLLPLNPNSLALPSREAL